MRHDWQKLSRAAVAVVTATGLTSCGGLVRKGPPAGGNEVVTAPPRAYYDQLFAAKLGLLDSGAATTTATSTGEVLWLNFGGATVAKGTAKGESFQVCGDKAQIAASTLTTDSQEVIASTVQKYYTDAGADLKVTVTQPTSGDYTTVVVGGSLADLGCSDPSGLGVAPLDVGNANHNDIAFVFTPADISDKQLAVNIAHVSAHTYGLATITDPNDVMAEKPLDTAKGFGVGKRLDNGAEQNGLIILAEATGVQVTKPGEADATKGDDTTNAPAPTSVPAPMPLPPVVAPGKGTDLIVDDMINKMPHNPKSARHIIPMLRGLLPFAFSLDLKAVTEIFDATGFGSGANSDKSGTGRRSTITVNVKVDISHVWKQGDAVAQPADEPTIATEPGTGTTAAPTGDKAAAPAATTEVAKTDVGANEPPKNPAEAAKVINSMPTIVNVITINFNASDSQRLLPLMKMGCLKKYMAARGE
ncbi:MAG: hypothetical protein FJ146_05120 [Deltaproteobacteria bacterium]|nr:hypothetical protein [Deltaproteobacteria bacterium]